MKNLTERNLSQCGAKTRSGKPCKAPATGSGYCNIHSNHNRAAELGRLGGLQNRHTSIEAGTEPVQAPRNAEQIRHLLAETLAGVRSGSVDPKIGTAVAYIANPLLKCLEINDFEKKLQELEQQISLPGVRKL
jgi:hypothetical protein